MKESIDWVPRTGTDASGFVRSYAIDVKGIEVPVIFHFPGTCPPGDIVLRTDELVDLSERTHIDVEVLLADRLLDPRTPMDYRTGLPLDPARRAEYDELCDGLRQAFGASVDPRTDPVIDRVVAVGRHAKAQDPATGAKSNTLFLFDEGCVKMQVAWRLVYPSYDERIDRIAERVGPLLHQVAKTMALPKPATKPR